jgi:hypothetical protein
VAGREPGARLDRPHGARGARLEHDAEREHEETGTSKARDPSIMMPRQTRRYVGVQTVAPSAPPSATSNATRFEMGRRRGGGLTFTIAGIPQRRRDTRLRSIWQVVSGALGRR